MSYDFGKQYRSNILNKKNKENNKPVGALGYAKASSSKIVGFSNWVSALVLKHKSLLFLSAILVGWLLSLMIYLFFKYKDILKPLIHTV